MSGWVCSLTRILSGRKVVNCRAGPDIRDTMQQELDEARHAEFERLYNAYRPAVHGYCARRTSPADAADAVSETFLVAWRRFLPNQFGLRHQRVVGQVHRQHPRRGERGACALS